MNKPLIVWVSQLTGTQAYDVPTDVLDKFDVRTTSITEDIDSLISNHQCAGVFFDFDYPDRRRLERFARAKARFPSIPFIIVTLQHSEPLAIWSFRIGATDYLVKPLQDAEVERCIDGLLMDAQSLSMPKNRQTKNPMDIPIPDTIPNMPNTKKQQLAPAVTYIRRNYSSKIVSDGMARLCGMSASQFGRAFKQVYDMTFQDFVVRYRVFQALNALQVPGANIAEIAYSVGFSDPSYFTRVFKRYVGIAPSELATSDRHAVKCPLDHEMIATDDSSTSQLVRSLSSSFKS